MYLFKVQAAIKIEGGCKVLKNFFCGFRKASIRKNNNCGKGTPVSTHKTCVSFNWNYYHFCGWIRSRSPLRKFLTPPPHPCGKPDFFCGNRHVFLIIFRQIRNCLKHMILREKIQITWNPYRYISLRLTIKWIYEIK